MPDTVNLAYGEQSISYGKDYIIPKPLDTRLITSVAPAVAKAAIKSGVAKLEIQNWEKYELELINRLGLDNKLIRSISNRAKRNPKRVVFAEAEHYKILKAAQQVRDEGIAEPILLGRENRILELIEENALELEGVKIIDPKSDARISYNPIL